MSEITEEIQNFKYNKHSSQGKEERISWIKEKLKPYILNGYNLVQIHEKTMKIKYYLS